MQVHGIDATRVEIRSRTGNTAGSISIQLLPQTYPSSPPPLLDLSEDQHRDPTIAPIQLLEDTEYRFEFSVSATGTITTDRPEVFQPDTARGDVGRVRPRSYTGTLPVTVFSASKALGTFILEVRSRKLDYLSEYRWMLKDIAEHSAELIMERFGVSEQTFVPSDFGDASTLYQRVAFLRSLIRDERFQAAIEQILRNPHVIWIDVEQTVRAGHSLRLDSHTARRFREPGPRVHWPGGVLTSLPANPIQARTETSQNTPANQFVKYALETWRSLLSVMQDLLRASPPTFAQRRGIAETTELLGWLEDTLSHDLFEAVGSLSRFPADNQVLHRREGYRDVFRSYLLFEAAALLSWSGAEDSFVAGQRDVATLYEYWVFLQLASVISKALGQPFRLATLLEVGRTGIELKLRKGRQVVVRGYTSRLGRKLQIELFFNRSFPPGAGVENTWTATMRPDYTVSIRDADETAVSFEPLLLHFDAKYRLSFLTEVFGSDPNTNVVDDPGSSSSPAAEATRSDLLKMHSYRDSIRRSVGAFVLYPGSESVTFREYHELLPGLGAFVLRPTASGPALGSDQLYKFIHDALDHVALQITQHERARYWNKRSYQSAPPLRAVAAAPFLSAPPADVQVLLGYVRSRAHLDWIAKTHLYNLRADTGRRGAVGVGAKELGCDLILLSCPATDLTLLARVVEVPRILTQGELAALGYPQPGGLAYFCYQLEFLSDEFWTKQFTVEQVELARRKRSPLRGAPVVVSWLELVAELGPPSKADQPGR